MSNGNGHSWSKFSWRDWSADKALHPCSLAAKGFWIEMLCIMHEGTPVGHLTLGGKPASIRQMAANAYCSEKEAIRCLVELEDAGVFSRTDDGTIYCRRMVKDAAASEAGREHATKRWNGSKPNGDPNGSPIRGANGKATGEPNAKNLEERKEEERPPVGPHGVGTGTPAEPGTPPARRADGTNPRAVGTNPRETGGNPRASGANGRAAGTNPRSRSAGWDECARQRREHWETIEGSAEHVVDLAARRLANG